MLESKFQADFIKMLRNEYPGCIVLKNDPTYLQGIPDLILLWENRWAAFEIKRATDSPVRANQNWYVDAMNKMSFAAYVHPDNVEEVIRDLQQAFGTRRPARAVRR